MENKNQPDLWYSMPKGNKILFLNPTSNKLYTRYDFASIEESFDMTGLYLVKLKFSKKHAIYNAKRNELSPKFDEFVSTDDMRHFVVKNSKGLKEYQTIFDLYINEFLSIQGKEISHIKNSNAYAIQLDTKTNLPVYKIYDTKSCNLYGPFVQFDSEALLNFIRVKKELGWQNDTYLLNLETGEQIVSNYEKRLYNDMIASADPASVDLFAEKTSSLTPEHLLYCLPMLEENRLKNEFKQTKRSKKTLSVEPDEEDGYQPE